MPLRELGAATAQLLRSKRGRARLVAEGAALLAREPRRRWMNRRPDFDSSDITAAPVDTVRTVERADTPSPVTEAAR